MPQLLFRVTVTGADETVQGLQLEVQCPASSCRRAEVEIDPGGGEPLPLIPRAAQSTGPRDKGDEAGNLRRSGMEPKPPPQHTPAGQRRLERFLGSEVFVLAQIDGDDPASIPDACSHHVNRQVVERAPVHQ